MAEAAVVVARMRRQVYCFADMQQTFRNQLASCGPLKLAKTFITE
jgi:hypothetical protein